MEEGSRLRDAAKQDREHTQRAAEREREIGGAKRHVGKV